MGHIANVAIDEGLIKNGKPDLERMDTLVYAQGLYFTLGTALGAHGYSLKSWKR